MSFQLLLPSPCNFLSNLCFIIVLLVRIQPTLTNSQIYRSCSLPFHCGKIRAGYPFWGGYRQNACGHPSLHLNCEKNDTPTLMIGDVKFRVLRVDHKKQVLKIARQDYIDGFCPRFNTTTINSTLFDFSDGYEMFKLIYGCPVLPVPGHSVCYKDGFVQKGATVLPGNSNTGFNFPVFETLLSAARGNKSALENALEGGFEMKWKLSGCDKSCRSCGYDIDSNQAICYRRYGKLKHSTVRAAHKIKGSSSFIKRRNIYIGIAASVAGIVIPAVLLYFAVGRFREKKTENDRKEEAFVRNYEFLVPKRYNYSDVKKMTKSFNYKLGQGGYGDVYKGKLPDGRLVAVKVLKKSKSNGEEFINEVASISRTSHVNVVTFMGFCYEKKKRALIYEFMPNGSLDQFIYDQESSSTHRKLEWRTMYQIAVGVARGLEYLHRGCNTRIVHFDIKPHNILLDEDLCPKISDFGLAKQSEKKESIISMLDARGTIGYIAPEVFCRNFGGVSHKSDVYSYGMMILEMVVGRKNADVKASSSSEVYFPNSIYKLLQSDNHFELHGVATEEEEEMAKRMMLVSLWCIQAIPSDRPSITEVVEMLEGPTENLQIPPKPSLSSPARSPKHKHSSPASLSTDQFVSQE